MTVISRRFSLFPGVFDLCAFPPGNGVVDIEIGFTAELSLSLWGIISA